MLSWQIAEEDSITSWARCQDQWPFHCLLHPLWQSIAVGIILTMLTGLWTQNKPLLFAGVCSAFLGPLPSSHTVILPIDWADPHQGPSIHWCSSWFISFSICFCIFMLNVLTFKLPQQIQLRLSLCIFTYMHIFSPSITLINLVLLTFESIGDKGSQGAEERNPEVRRGFQGALCSPNVGSPLQRPAVPV